MKKINNIGTSIKNVTGVMKFKVNKHKPEIYLAVGIASGIAATVSACRATLKVNDVLEEHKKNIQTIKETAANPDFKDKYSEEDKQRDITVQYTKTALGVIKLYGPSIILGTLSIASVCASNNIMRQRNAALAAAYTAVDGAFKKYRDRVVDKYGAEVDQELRYGTKAQEIIETEVDEKGKEKAVKKKVDIVSDPDAPSEFARYFTKGNPDFNDKDPDLNEMFFRAQQNYLNDMLIINGHLTLNQAYKALNMKETKAGLVVGWIFDKNGNTEGDNYVQIIRKPVYIPNESDGTSTFAYLIDFNVDGNIYDKM